jgi:hypothetical protein
MKIHNRTHITLTPDDIKQAIVKYLINEGVTPIFGIEYDTKFVVHDVYQKDSLTGYYKSEFAGAEVTIKEYS